MIYFQLYSGWGDLIVSPFQLAEEQQLSKVMLNLTITVSTLSDGQKRVREELAHGGDR